MTVFDCFIAHDEIEAIRARCCELPHAVHVALDSDHTFRGDPKPSYLHGPGVDLGVDGLKVHTLTVRAPAIDPWENERSQRDALVAVLEAVYRPAADDLVIAGDADEIPRGAKLADIQAATEQAPVRLAMRMHYYSPFWIQPGGVAATVAFRWRDRPRSLTDMRRDPKVEAVNDCGWHLSYFGGVDRVRRKVASFSHHEYDRPLTHAQVPAMIDRGIHINSTMLDRWDGSDMPCGL